jgi:hypothetical protein
MIDGFAIKVEDPECISKIKKNPLLKWYQNRVDIETGEVGNQTADFPQIDHYPQASDIILRFSITTKDVLYIKGSLHRFKNFVQEGTNHNFNDFSINDLITTIIDICNRFGINPYKCKVNPFEFGVNIISPIPPTEILRSIIDHNGTQFNQEFSKDKYFRECSYGQYSVKAYDKGKQNNLDVEIFRFEIKVRKMEYLNKRFSKENLPKINTLSDLLHPPLFVTMGALLNENWNDLLFYDYSIDFSELRLKDQVFLSQGQNPQNWEQWRQEGHRNTYLAKRHKFKSLIQKYGNQNIQHLIGNLISGKWENLSQVDNEIMCKMTTFLNSFRIREIVQNDLYSTMSICTISIREYARQIGCDESYIRKARQRGKIPDTAFTTNPKNGRPMVIVRIANETWSYIARKNTNESIEIPCQSNKRPPIEKPTPISELVSQLPNTEIQHEVVSLREYARQIGCDESYIRKARQRGKIPDTAFTTNPKNGRPMVIVKIANETWSTHICYRSSNRSKPRRERIPSRITGIRTLIRHPLGNRFFPAK